MRTWQKRECDHRKHKPSCGVCQQVEIARTNYILDLQKELEALPPAWRRAELEQERREILDGTKRLRIRVWDPELQRHVTCTRGHQ